MVEELVLLCFQQWIYYADNRICVWNANDGSLVHSLVGHTASVRTMFVLYASCLPKSERVLLLL